MNLKEAASLLCWKREQLLIAIGDGVETPHKKLLARLVTTKQGSDFDIREEDIDRFLDQFEAEEPGRHPPLAVRRALLVESGYQCAVCRSDAPLRFHHILDWASLKHHDPRHMLAICGSCHDKIHLGQIDIKSQREFKARLVHPVAGSAKAIVPGAHPSTRHADEIIDASDFERVVWSLPRGFVMLQDITFDDHAGWAVVAHYYHLGEGWRMGTHFHKSYGEHWRTHRDLDVQCHKLGIPDGDRDFAYGGLYLMREIRDADKKIDIRQKVAACLESGYPVRFYAPSLPVYLRDVEGKYPEWNGTHALRDLLAEIDDILATDFSHSVASKLSEEGFSIAHRIVVETTKFFGVGHPSTRFIQKTVDEYDVKLSEAQIREWMSRLRRTVFDALQSR